MLTTPSTHRRPGEGGSKRSRGRADRDVDDGSLVVRSSSDENRTRERDGRDADDRLLAVRSSRGGNPTRRAPTTELVEHWAAALLCRGCDGIDNCDMASSREHVAACVLPPSLLSDTAACDDDAGIRNESQSSITAVLPRLLGMLVSSMTHYGQDFKREVNPPGRATGDTRSIGSMYCMLELFRKYCTHTYFVRYVGNVPFRLQDG